MKLFTTAALAASLCITSVPPVLADDIMGSVRSWQYMHAGRRLEIGRRYG